MKKILKWVFVIIVIAFALSLFTGRDDKSSVGSGGGNDTPDEYWDIYRLQDVAQTSDEWGEPILLSFSTPGWEEGDYISLDGKTFYFIYTTVDIFKLIFFGDEKTTGSILDNDKQCTHPLNPNPHTCGEFPRADQFFVEKKLGGWTKPKPHPLTLDEPIGGITLVGNNKAYFMSPFGDDIEEIGYAEKVDGKWGEKIKIESVSTDKYSDSDPFVNQEDNEMFFWSDRPAKFGGKNIYRSIKIGGEWQTPEILPAPINTDGDDMQTFLFGNTLYFTSNLMPEGHPHWIFKSERLGDNSWSEPELVISSQIGVGEPSLTADGKKLYFEQIFTDGKNNFNPDMLYVERVK